MRFIVEPYEPLGLGGCFCLIFNCNCHDKEDDCKAKASCQAKGEVSLT